MLFCFGLIPRYITMLRPHAFSYIFIPFVLFLIEKRSRHLILLPILTILWVNFHGVEYPVILIISLSYLFEYSVKRFKYKIQIDKKTFIFFICPLVLVLWTIIINPYHFNLLSSPFNFADYQSQYILELKKIDIKEFLSFRLYPFAEFTWSALNIIIILSCIGCIKGIIKKNIRISHALLLLGGLALLFMSERFRYEAVLLTLPLLKYNPLFSFSGSRKPIAFLLKVIISITLVLYSFIGLHDLFGSRGKYPLSDSHLPSGVTAFLNHIRVGGYILNNPDYGGYLQWALGPEYKIAMDLQMIIFSDEDYFSVVAALNTKEGFSSFIDKFHPGFIITNRTKDIFGEVVKDFPEYKILFFDNASVLYANANTYPIIAAKYSLKEIDPYRMLFQDVTKMEKGRIDVMLSELQTMHNIYNKNLLIQYQMGRLYKTKGELKKALSYTDSIIEEYPEFVEGHLLKGDILMEHHSFNEALSSYLDASYCKNNNAYKTIHKKISFAYFKAGNNKKAYQHLKKAINIFFPLTEYKDLWQLGNMALVEGKINEGTMLLQFALTKTPSSDKTFAKRIQDQLNKLNH